MRRLIWAMLFVAPVRAQTPRDAGDLLAKVKAFGENTKSWSAEVIQISRLTMGPSIKLKSEIHTKVAAQPLLKVSRVNSGDDRTTMVCDGVEFFYSGDGHSYYRHEATQQCSLPLIAFYEPSFMRLYDPSNASDSVSIIGEDRVRLADGERRCVVVRAVSKRGSMHDVRTMCIDPSDPIILRDVMETEDEATGNTSFTETTFISFENNPTFPSSAFRITVPPGALEAKPPM